MKKVITTFLLFCIINTTAIAVDFDESVDATIRENYGIEQSSLPPLPSNVPTTVPTLLPDVEEITTFNPTGKMYTLKSGTKVRLQSKSSISEWAREGAKVSFLSKEGIITREGEIIPAGTIFKATITDSHRPQITGNGGLIEFTVDEIYFNGVMSKIDTKISKANSKTIFLNNIKGERRYWKNFAKDLTPGVKAFNATKDFAKEMKGIPVINLVGAASMVGGAAVYVVNVVVAPVVSVFQKGGSISLPSGTEFEIKITENNQIKG